MSASLSLTAAVATSTRMTFCQLVGCSARTAIIAPCVPEGQRFRFFVYCVIVSFAIKLALTAIWPTIPDWVSLETKKRAHEFSKKFLRQHKLKEELLDDQLGLRQVWLLDVCGMRNSTHSSFRK